MKKFCAFVLIATSVCAQKSLVPTSIIDSHTHVALKVYEDHISLKENFIFSGLSLDMILALTYLGARGETANQIRSVLKLNISDTQLKSDIKAVTDHLKHPQDVVIETANKIYLANGIKVEPEFLKTAVDDFSSGVENVNFGEAQEASDKINSWVAKQTHQRIKDLTNPGQFSPLTRIALVNTLYFKGNWFQAFDHTEKMDFHKSKTEVVQVDMMKLTRNLLVQRNPSQKVSLVQLPFVHRNARLIIVLPDEYDGMADMDKNLPQIEEQLSFAIEYVQVLLPKFKIETTVDMIPVLKRLGITDLFINPDLSGIAKENLVVSSITQKVFLEIDELGAEGAAATTVVAENYAASAPKPDPKIFKVDHPFMFGLEYDGLYLMTGRVVNI